MILSHEKTIPSCKVLRDEIEKISGVHLLITSNPEKIRDKRLHIRFGNSEPVAGKHTDYNSPAPISKSANKQRFSRLARREGLISPELRRLSLEKPSRGDFPVIVRKNLGGKAGEGIVGVFDNLRQVRRNSLPNYYWAKFYKFDYELRVHTFEGEIIRMFSKKAPKGFWERYPIRVDKNYHFSLINHKRAFRLGKYRKLRRDVGTIYENVLGANFFALDVGWCPNLQDYVYLESGTAMGLNQNTAREYAKRLVPKVLS